MRSLALFLSELCSYKDREEEVEEEEEDCPHRHPHTDILTHTHILAHIHTLWMAVISNSAFITSTSSLFANHPYLRKLVWNINDRLWKLYTFENYVNLPSKLLEDNKKSLPFLFQVSMWIVYTKHAIDREISLTSANTSHVQLSRTTLYCI